MMFAMRFSARTRFLSAAADSESSYVCKLLLLLLFEEPLEDEMRICCFLLSFPLGEDF
jgi:hypothetical protein